MTPMEYGRHLEEEAIKALGFLDERKLTPEAYISELLKLGEISPRAAIFFMVHKTTPITFTDEEVRELVRHLALLIRVCEDPIHHEVVKATDECKEFLEKHKYFNFKQSELV